MKHRGRIVRAAAALGLCVLAGPAWNHAHAKDQWQRVYTAEDSVIEINSASLRFESGNILRTDYRTTFSKAETIGGDSGGKYKTRLEKIDFRFTDFRYRFVEISLLDPSGKVLQTKRSDGAEDWRSFKPGGITERLFNAACALTPLGSWKVVSYRFAEGDPKDARTTAHLDRLIGAAVNLSFVSADVGGRVCSSASFEDKDATQDESLRQLGIEWKSIGIKPENARTIDVKCHESGWEPPRSLLVKDNNKEEMLLLWEGVFLVLKRTQFHGIRVLRRNP
jgi:hypothetical protein